jgi:hypothetical protein
MGRPSKYRPEFCERARILCEGGARDVELAKAFEVNITTIKVWKCEHAEFRAAIKIGKEVADDIVEKSLYERATGYSHDAVKIFQYEGTPVQVPYIEHVPPDPVSMIFWLKNRRPKEWRDKQEHELTGANGGPLTTVGINTNDPVEAAKAYQRIISGE